MKGLIRVAASVAFYDFVPTIPALRELAECQTRCADMYKQFKGHDRLVNALLGQTSMAEYATEHMGGTGRSGTALLILRLLYYL